jgi:hypothetical protein
MAEEARGRPPSRRQSERHPGVCLGCLSLQRSSVPGPPSSTLPSPAPAGADTLIMQNKANSRVGEIDANQLRHKDLRWQCIRYGRAKTKPILARQVVEHPRGASGPARQNKSVVRGRTTHSTIAQGKLYQENALRRHYEQGQSCRTKPIRPGRELVVTVGRARG